MGTEVRYYPVENFEEPTCTEYIVRYSNGEHWRRRLDGLMSRHPPYKGHPDSYPDDASLANALDFRVEQGSMIRVEVYQ